MIFGNKLYRQIVGIPMGTNCSPLVADLFLFYYERDFITSLSDDNQADIIGAFNSTSRIAFKQFHKNDGTLYLACNDKKAFFTSTDHGLVRMYVTPYRVFWIIFTSDLVISDTDTLLVFRWVQIVPSCSRFVFILLLKRFHDFSFC